MSFHPLLLTLKVGRGPNSYLALGGEQIFAHKLFVQQIHIQHTRELEVKKNTYWYQWWVRICDIGKLIEQVAC
jgi:hypothetical protein